MCEYGCTRRGKNWSLCICPFLSEKEKHESGHLWLRGSLKPVSTAENNQFSYCTVAAAFHTGFEKQTTDIHKNIAVKSEAYLIYFCLTSVSMCVKLRPPFRAEEAVASRI